MSNSEDVPLPQENEASKDGKREEEVGTRVSYLHKGINFYELITSSLFIKLSQY